MFDSVFAQLSAKRGVAAADRLRGLHLHSERADAVVDRSGYRLPGQRVCAEQPSRVSDRRVSGSAGYGISPHIPLCRAPSVQPFSIPRSRLLLHRVVPGQEEDRVGRWRVRRAGRLSRLRSRRLRRPSPRLGSAHRTTRLQPVRRRDDAACAARRPRTNWKASSAELRRPAQAGHPPLIAVIGLLLREEPA